MVASDEDLENLLTRLERSFERIGDGTFLVAMGPRQPPAAVSIAPPVLVLRVDVGDFGPAGDTGTQLTLAKRLLQLNASDMLHAAYGLEGNTIILTAALELQNLDPNELDAALSDLDLALVEHVPELRRITTTAS